MTTAEVVDVLRAAGCVFAEDEAALLEGEATSPEELDVLVARRVAGEPLEQVVGWADFAGVRVRLEPGVFVPRQRTTLMVDEAVRLLGGVAHPVVLDLCCGSGAIGLAVATRTPCELFAADVDPTAVHCARGNLRGLDGRVFEGDLFDPLPTPLRGRVQVLTCNVPYVPTDAIASMPPEARDHEPHVTLDGGSDGLDVLRRVAARARQWLAPGGSLLVEVSTTQVPDASAVFALGGLTPRLLRDDDVGATVLVGTKDPAGTAGGSPTIEW
jgi:release factor glutamine methyltransferase